MDSTLYYDETFVTCQSTYATLCIYLPDIFDPNVLSEKFGIQPSRTQVKGEIIRGRIRAWPTAWFLRSQGHVQSKDLRRHVDWLLDLLSDKLEILEELRTAGSELKITCFWVSAHGYGGPILDRDILKRLAGLGLAIEFDIYFAGDDANDIFDKASTP